MKTHTETLFSNQNFHLKYLMTMTDCTINNDHLVQIPCFRLSQAMLKDKSKIVVSGTPETESQVCCLQ